MNENPNNKQAVSHIILPSGRTVDVIRFSEPGAEHQERRPLHICPRCESDLVEPLSWFETSDHNWELLLDCPNCGWSEAGVFSRDQVERLEDHLDDALAGMLADLKRLTQENLAAEIERFAAALDAGLILPEDF